MTSIVRLQGVNDRNEIHLYPGPGGRLQRGMRDAVTMLPHIDLHGVAVKTCRFFGPGSRQPRYRVPEDAALVVNEITEPETHRVALQRAAEFCAGAGLPVINHPATVARWTRDAVARALGPLPGVVMPATLRLAAASPREVLETAAASGLAFPLTCREAGAPAGHGAILLRGAQDGPRLHRFAFDGRDFYLAEFRAVADAAGRYRWHRLAFVDRRPLPEASLVDERWNARPPASARYLARHPEPGRETELLQGLEAQLPRLAARLDGIAGAIDLDFFSMGFQLNADGQLLVNEVNASLNIGAAQPTAPQPWVEHMRAALRNLLADRLAA